MESSGEGREMEGERGEGGLGGRDGTWGLATQQCITHSHSNNGCSPGGVGSGDRGVIIDIT